MAESGGGENGGEIKDLAEIRDLVRSLKAGGGGADPTGKLAEVLADNARLRQKLRDARAAAPAVPEGAAVLSPDEAKAWKKYQELGDPGDLRKALDAGTAAAAELGESRRADRVRQAAEVSGLKATVLSRLVRADGLELDVVDGEDRDGKPVRVAYVMHEGEKKTPLLDHARAHWGEMLPALPADPDRNPFAAPSRPLGGTPPAEARRSPAPRPGRATEDDVLADLAATGRYGPA